MLYENLQVSLLKRLRFSFDGRFSRYKIQDDDENKPLLQDKKEGRKEVKEEEEKDEVPPPDCSGPAAPTTVPLNRQQNEPSEPEKLVVETCM